MGRLDGKVALVTGGGTGIGRATSLLLASEGADVAVNYSRSLNEAEATAADIRSLGRNSIAIRTDVSVESAVREMVDRVVGELGRLDILVNNAGTTVFVPLADLEALTDDAWDPVFDVNVKGAFYCARAAIARMPEAGGPDRERGIDRRHLRAGQLHRVLRLQSGADLPHQIPGRQPGAPHSGKRRGPRHRKHTLGKGLGRIRSRES